MTTSALRILAVDNEPSVTFSLSNLFNAPRYELAATENGDTALARLDSAQSVTTSSLSIKKNRT